MTDLYILLGVERSASSSEIKAAYKRRILLCHPDRCSQGNEEFQSLQHAWGILGDPVSRRRYDISSDGMSGTKYTLFLPPMLESTLEERPAISQEVDLEEMQYDETAGSFTLLCRCGGKYTVFEDELEENIDVIGCSGCSLSIRVLFEADCPSP